jgi:hypothetical protein
MHSRDDSDRLSWALSALVVLIMGVAVGVSSRQSPPAHNPDPGTPTADEQSQHSEVHAQSRSGTARSPEPLSTERAARL